VALHVCSGGAVHCAWSGRMGYAWAGLAARAARGSGRGGALAASTVRRQGWQQARVRTGEKSSHGIGTR
jgi:hypothetical protein